MIDKKWILCPACKNRTRLRMREDTELKNFPLYCPKCKQINMKKILLKMLCLAMTIVLAACGGSNMPETPTSPEQATVAPTPETQQNIEVVEITVPATVYEGVDFSTFDTDKYAELNGFISTTINDDGSMTLKMTKACQNEFIEARANELRDMFEDYVGGEDTPYTITYNANFTEVTIEVDSEKYDNIWDFSPMVVGMSAAFYPAFTVDGFTKVDVYTVDSESGEVLNTYSLPTE